MKILLINLILHTAEKGVIPRYKSNEDCMIYNMARGFIANGHSVTLVASEEFRPIETENPGFEVIYFPSALPKVFRPDLLPYPKGLKGWLRRNASHYDVIITSETFSLGTLFAVREAQDKVVIWQEMALMQHAFKKIPANLWYRVVVPLFMKNVRVVARSVNARGFIRQFMSNVADEVVDHGTNGDIFYPGEKDKDSSFVVVARLVSGKRIDRIIRRFATFVNASGNAAYVLDIVGDGPERGSLEKLSEELGIAGNVVFHGRLAHSDFAAIGRKALAMLVDTEKDLNMVSIPESIANGTPVLMNTVPTTASFVNREGLGIAKEDWTSADLEAIVRDNQKYVANCIRVRESLLNTGCAARLLDFRGI